MRKQLLVTGILVVADMNEELGQLCGRVQEVIISSPELILSTGASRLLRHLSGMN